MNGKIDVEKIGELDATYEDFLTDLKKMDGDKKDCRYAGDRSNIKALKTKMFFFKFTIMNTLSYPRERMSHSKRAKSLLCAGVLMTDLSGRRCCTHQALTLSKRPTWDTRR